MILEPRKLQVKLLFDDSHIINMSVAPKEKSNWCVVTKAQVGNVTKETISKSVTSLEDSRCD